MFFTSVCVTELPFFGEKYFGGYILETATAPLFPTILIHTLLHKLEKKSGC